MTNTTHQQDEDRELNKIGGTATERIVSLRMVLGCADMTSIAETNLSNSSPTPNSKQRKEDEKHENHNI